MLQRLLKAIRSKGDSKAIIETAPIAVEKMNCTELAGYFASLMQAENTTFGGICDVCKRSLELAFFENKIEPGERQKAKDIFSNSYAILFHKKEKPLSELETTVKGLFDSKLESVSRFGVSSILWGLNEYNVEGEDVLSFAVQRKYSDVFAHFFDPISRREDAAACTGHLILAMASECAASDPATVNLPNKLFYLILSNNGTAKTLFKRNIKALMGCLKDYKEAYSILTNGPSGGEILLRTAAICINLKEKGNSIPYHITFFQNNAVPLNEEAAVALFFNEIAHIKDKNGSKGESLEGIRTEHKSGIAFLFLIVSAWTSFNLNKQYYPDAIPQILDSKSFAEASLGSFITSLDNIYLAWIANGPEDWSLGLTILVDYMKTDPIFAKLLSEVSESDHEYVVSVGDMVTGVIISTIEHYFYVASQLIA